MLWCPAQFSIMSNGRKNSSAAKKRKVRVSEISLKMVRNLPFQRFLKPKFSLSANHGGRHLWRLWVTFQKFCSYAPRHNIPLATAEQINKIVKKLNPNKAKGPEKIPPKIVILSANIIDSHLANIINHGIDNNNFSEVAKIPTVRLIYKKSNRDKIENYRPVSILNCFSKVYKRFPHEQFEPFVETFVSGFFAAYREGYSCNHVLMQLIENWKRALDENFQIGALLMDVSVFDCILHDLLIAKFYAYGLSEETTTSFYSYLKRRGKE